MAPIDTLDQKIKIVIKWKRAAVAVVVVIPLFFDFDCEERGLLVTNHSERKLDGPREWAYCNPM